MQVSTFMIVAVVLALFFASVAAKTTLYERTSTPDGWTKDIRTPSSIKVSFTLALIQKNTDVLERIAAEVSNPFHDEYQNYKTIEEINTLIGPSADEMKVIMNKLMAYGITKKQMTNWGDAIKISGVSVSIAEQIFSTTFYNFVSDKDGMTIAKAWGEYTLPTALVPHVDMVFGLSNFPVPKPKQHGVISTDPNALTEAIIPQSIYTIYGVPANQIPLAQSSFSQGVIEFESESFSNKDLLIFGNITGVNVSAVAAENIIGVNNENQPGVESSLDIQFVAGVNIQATSWFYIQNPVDWLYEFGVAFFNNATIPKIVSISYGWWEEDQCRWDSGVDRCTVLGVDNTGYVRRVNWEFAKINTRGVSIIVASGDSGANGRTDPDCSIKQLRPAYPSSSPYVTSVGATEIVNSTYNLTNPPSICGKTYSCVSGGYEQAVSIKVSGFASGGGFSNISSRPDWQWDAVATYLNSSVKLPPASYYNGMGRGAPDISAIGHNGLIVVGGGNFPVGGTSQSAPTIAAVFGLLQVPYFAKTGNTLGFLNPLIYYIQATSPSAFIDITTGDNICTEGGCSAGCTGYVATKGWDPVTGVGSPNYPALLDAIERVADMVVARRNAKAAKQQ